MQQQISSSQQCSICGKSLKKTARAKAHVKCTKAEAQKIDPKRQNAQHMARYSHRDYLTWFDKDGTRHVEPKSVKALEQAMLATGPDKHFYVNSANDGIGMLVHRWMAENMLDQAKRGY